jgi:hypothetical protein
MLKVWSDTTKRQKRKISSMCIRHESRKISNMCMEDMSQYNLTKCGTRVTYVYLLQLMFGHGQMFNMWSPWIQTRIEEEIWIWIKLETTDSIQLHENDEKALLPLKDPHPAFNKQIFKGRSSVNPP